MAIASNASPSYRSAYRPGCHRRISLTGINEPTELIDNIWKGRHTGSCGAPSICSYIVRIAGSRISTDQTSA